IDPGIGFGKDFSGNIQILKHLDEFKDLTYPVLIGTSRKSFIGKFLGTETENMLYGTIASNIIALVKGAMIFRVHDIKENKSAIDLAYKILKT
ncbi:MAG: dihydropteroate synthase, partial [Candidatus Delongbacteria bacterium]|nr:dihydropteroate synthase [Candidatus Delongbacteria bacterium]MCG2759580.1 dihydropteroate synthase [Candidatus Delongbacteria bacterium]